MLLTLHPWPQATSWEMITPGNADDDRSSRTVNSTPSTAITEGSSPDVSCPSCGHQFYHHQQGKKGRISLLPGLPAGVRFDPTDAELLDHLDGKVRRQGDGSSQQRSHPLIDEFIVTLEGENGICYTHPEKLPGVSMDGQIKHFFHRPSKAYTTGTRKRRKVDSEDGGEMRWHKTGKTRPILVDGTIKGQKKILVLYTNYSKLKKPEKTNWVMHQYHLGPDDDEKDGELVVSKVFYQTQPRQSGGSGAGVKKPSSGVISHVHQSNYYDYGSAIVCYDGGVVAAQSSR